MAQSRRRLLRDAGSLLAIAGGAGCLHGPGRSTTDDAPISTITLVHWTSGTSTTTATATDRKYRLLEERVTWGDLPVPFRVAMGTVPDGLDSAGVRGAVTAATEAWNGVANTPSVFATPTFDADRQSITVGNRVNELAWRPLGDEKVGRTQLRWNTETSRFVEVDILLNDSLSWSTTAAASAFDVQSIVTHELGHCGLRDVRHPAQTMYYLSAPGETQKRTLETGDENGWRRLYG